MGKNTGLAPMSGYRGECVGCGAVVDCCPPPGDRTCDVDKVAADLKAEGWRFVRADGWYCPDCKHHQDLSNMINDLQHAVRGMGHAGIMYNAVLIPAYTEVPASIKKLGHWITSLQMRSIPGTTWFVMADEQVGARPEEGSIPF